MKDILNIVSYLLNAVFLIIILVLLNTRGESNTKSIDPSEKLEIIKATIIEAENANMPLRVQSLARVHGITLDSLVFTNNVEPYRGYLISTWDVDEQQTLTTNQWVANGYEDKWVRKKKTILVGLTEMTISDDNMVHWMADWSSAYFTAKSDK